MKILVVENLPNRIQITPQRKCVVYRANLRSIIAKLLIKICYHASEGREIVVYLGYPGSDNFRVISKISGFGVAPVYVFLDETPNFKANRESGS